MPRFLTEFMEALPSETPFVGPEALERQHGQGFLARLGANESVFGPSPKAVAAMAAGLEDVSLYADPEHWDCRTKLAAHHGLTPNHIMMGEGIDGLFGVLARLVCDHQTKVVTSAGAYPTFVFQMVNNGAEIIRVPYRDDHEDPEALLQSAGTYGAKLCYLSNPDNPMGSWILAKDILNMLDKMPEECLLVLDEAYQDFAPADALLPNNFIHPQLLRFRTFSKAHGLAGLRVGYVFGPEHLVRAFNKIRNHFGMNRLGLTAAMASLDDKEHLENVRRQVAASKAKIKHIAHAHGCNTLPSATNFVAVDLGGDGTLSQNMVAALAKRQVFVRMPMVAPLNRCIRITAGGPEAMNVLEQVFGPALHEASEHAL